MNIHRIEKAIVKAERKIAMKKLKEMNINPFVDSRGRKSALKIFCLKPKEKLNAEQQKEKEEFEKVCKKSGLEPWIVTCYDNEEEWI